ncbi:GIY-YIG nuclease family protein, partial [Streptomyces mirabilis]|uniref:GIY-YIG nuclease family protein n=1 Tax=Streptomyces mirabilis TaxID=68239 RepID=UPI00367E0300
LSVLESVDDVPGVYVFARTYGHRITPLYIGKALNLRGRIKQQLNNLRLMRQIQDWEKNGARVLLLGYLKVHGSQDVGTALDVSERALIEHGLAEGHPLVNVQGTRTPFHTLSFTGNRMSEQVAPRQMFVKA